MQYLPCGQLWVGHALMIAMLIVMRGAAIGADGDTPVDVSDDFGLGERLALVAWLNDHHVVIADSSNLPALRIAYLTKAHPSQDPAVSEAALQQRSDLAAELYRKYGKNPPNGASADDIKALITSLDEQSQEAIAREQAIAHADTPGHQFSSSPKPAQPATRSEVHPSHTEDAPIAVDGDWTESLEAARALSKQTGKPILADFTGSDWCMWCKMLHNEVFATPNFKAWAKDHVVLLLVDFPKKTAKSPEITAQNAKLAKQFSIQGFPTVVIMDAAGNKIGQQGYEKGGPMHWIADIMTVIETVK